MTHGVMIPAAIYVRISDDTEGDRAGVKRQEADCRAVCEGRGWVVGGVYEDNDRSAYRGGSRPGYERLLGDMRNRVVGAVVVWHLDRLTRHPRELEEFMEIANNSDVELATATGEVDLGSGDGRLMARLMGAVAAKESDDKSRRLLRKHEELAQAGKVAGGGHRPFGFEPDRVTHRPDETALIREAAERLLATESIRSILTDWNSRGISTSAGGEWTPTSFKRVMRSPRIAGLREHHGETVSDAEWAPIIDTPTHHRLLARLQVSLNGGTYRSRSYLLTGGLAVCGRCGAALVARPRADKRRAYVCAKGPGQHGCNGISILAEPLEEHIGAAVIEALDGPALEQILQADQETDSQDAQLWAQIRADQDQLEQLSRDHYVEGRISRPEYFAARDGLENRITQTKGKLQRDTRTRMLAELPAGRQQLQDAWDQADIDWRHALTRTIVDHITIRPAAPGRNTYDPNRAQINWRN